MKERLLPIQVIQSKKIHLWGGVWPPYQGFPGVCPASISQQIFLLLLSLLTNSQKSREGFDLHEASCLSNFQHKPFQERMSQAYSSPRLWLARDGLQLPGMLQTSHQLWLGSIKFYLCALGGSCSESREKGAIKLLWQLVVNLHENSSISEHGNFFYSSCACLFQFFYINNHLFRTGLIHENSANFSKKRELLEKPKMMIY